jgi:hypothetical protein
MRLAAHDDLELAAFRFKFNGQQVARTDSALRQLFSNSAHELPN